MNRRDNGEASHPSESLRETVFALRRECGALQVANAQAEQLLGAIENLLGHDAGDDVLSRVFNSLRQVFDCSNAMMLERDLSDAGQGLVCVYSDVYRMLGSRWPGASLFRKVLRGRAVACFSGRDVPEWGVAVEFGLAPECASLHIPVRVRERRGIAILVRAPGSGGFDRDDVRLARRFSVLMSAALAARNAQLREAESDQLRALSAQLRQSEQKARRNSDLINAMIDALPIGVAVQDRSGTLALVNEAAAHALGTTRARAQGKLPHFLAEREHAERRLAVLREHIGSGLSHSRERKLHVDGGERTLLITGTPVSIFDEPMLLSTVVDVTERKQFEEQLRVKAFYDDLTGLPNRALANEIVSNALRTRRGDSALALAFVDLDNFKQVNDYFGHVVGDRLLVEVARRLRSVLRQSDMLARFSGDAFLLSIDPVDGRDELDAMLSRVSAAMRTPFEVNGQELMTSATIGASLYPEHGKDFDVLMRRADNAMFIGKTRSRGSHVYFDPAHGDELNARVAMEWRLRNALRDKRLRIAYQPKVSRDDQVVRGYEALIRWVEPDGSVITPGSFIHLASELGLLDEITLWVVDQVARDLPALSERHGNALSISFNVSARQAGEPRFMLDMIRHIERVGGVSQRLVVEITEDALLATHRFQSEILPAMKRSGLRVAIDDFGTGYSSLSALANLSADEIKIDRAFISGIDRHARNQGILKAIESVCAALGIRMVAEGVETEAELDYLKHYTGIQLIQGYYFGRPAFIESILRM